jgi:hypothetical protein
MIRLTLRLVGVVVCLWWSASALLAQSATGALYGTVVDGQGNPLPGATVTLDGPGADRVQVTDSEGRFRFLDLDPAQYTIRTELDGFATLDIPNVQVNANRNTTIDATLSSASIEEEVIVVGSGASGADPREAKPGVTLRADELERIPTARDPWAILQ